MLALYALGIKGLVEEQHKSNNNSHEWKGNTKQISCSPESVEVKVLTRSHVSINL